MKISTQFMTLYMTTAQTANGRTTPRVNLRAGSNVSITVLGEWLLMMDGKTQGRGVEDRDEGCFILPVRHRRRRKFEILRVELDVCVQCHNVTALILGSGDAHHPYCKHGEKS